MSGDDIEAIDREILALRDRVAEAHRVADVRTDLEGLLARLDEATRRRKQLIASLKRS